MNVSVVIPAFNEEEGIGLTLKYLLENLSNIPLKCQHEIIVVDDGSTDRTAGIAEAIAGIKVIRQPHNMGYGAALKSGVRAAKYDWILTLDSDGQHLVKDLFLFWEAVEHGYDLIIGKRQKGSHKLWSRQFGKEIIRAVANYLADENIPDLNSGIRLFRRNLFLKYMPLYPNGFSISATMTIASIGDGHYVKFVPVTTHKRVGRRSNVNLLKDGFNTIIMIIRTVSLFNPLRIFIPPSIIFGFIGIYMTVSHIIHYGTIPKSSILVLLGSLLIFLFGVLIDQLSLLRQQHSEMDNKIHNI